MKIPEPYLESLRSARLLISEPFVPNHVAFPDGVSICKPKAAGGNAIPELEGYWGPDDNNLVIVDAPVVWFHTIGGKWIVTVHEYVPGPGPGDFVNEHDSPAEAVADILDFFFGDPGRMEVKRSARAELKEKLGLP